MGCCKSKVDENANINYDNEDDIPNFEIQQPNNQDNSNYRFNSPMDKNNNYGPSDSVVKAKGGLNDNPKFNKTLEEERTADSRNANSIHNGGKNSVLNFNSVLILTITESKFKEKNTVLEINPKGLVGSTRNANDGIVYFGLHAPDFKNDYCFKPEEGVNKRHFEIKFDKENIPGYYVKNLQGSGVFIKVNDYLNLKDGVIISFGTNHLLVSITHDDEQTDLSIIKFKSIYGPNKGNE